MGNISAAAIRFHSVAATAFAQSSLAAAGAAQSASSLLNNHPAPRLANFSRVPSGQTFLILVRRRRDLGRNG
ncbi:hypothetical protein LX36DRAFT_650241 [Colletotrichum falcatum]|nr:hypothetical protein LX36DRAFT_650241 [Colletotrichum falcatum]